MEGKFRPRSAYDWSHCAAGTSSNGTARRCSGERGGDTHPQINICCVTQSSQVLGTQCAKHGGASSSCGAPKSSLWESLYVEKQPPPPRNKAPLLDNSDNRKGQSQRHIFSATVRSAQTFSPQGTRLLEIVLTETRFQSSRTSFIVCLRSQNTHTQNKIKPTANPTEYVTKFHKSIKAEVRKLINWSWHSLTHSSKCQWKLMPRLSVYFGDLATFRMRLATMKQCFDPNCCNEALYNLLKL